MTLNQSYGQVLSNFFSRDPTKDFAFEIFDRPTTKNDENFFVEAKAKRKNVSVGVNENFKAFVCDLKIQGTNGQDLAKAKICAKKLKTLKHPAFLTFVDCCETDSLVYIVTEEAVGLRDYLQHTLHQNPLRESWLCWGLYQVTTGLQFLNESANLVYNNLNLSSIFVNQAGDWKIFSLQNCKPYDQVCKEENFVNTACCKYALPDDRAENYRKRPWSIDIWALSIFIYEIFNGEISTSRDRNSMLKILKSPKLIPKNLHTAYVELLKINCCKFSAFLDEFSRNFFTKNDLIDFLLCLEQFQVKDQSEKSKFFHKLNDETDRESFVYTFPKNVLKFKILPQLINMFEFGDAGAKIIQPMLKIGKDLNESEYELQITPTLVKLFASPDRATRVKLLKEIDFYISYLQPSIVNEKIFQHFVNGFMDSNPAVREATLKAVVSLSPKLNYQNLNVELMKHFARLQIKDDQPAIRTNATVCLGKIAAYLDPSVREKILISAFCRSFQDLFAPARIAGILALTATQQFYTARDICCKIMPALCPLTMDNDEQVRRPALKALRGFLEKMQEASDKRDLIAQMEQNAKSSSSAVAPINQNWASWAISALGSKFYKPPPKNVQSSPDAPAPSLQQQPAVEDNKAREGSREVVDEEPENDEAQSGQFIEEGDDEPWEDFGDQASKDQNGWHDWK